MLAPAPRSGALEARRRLVDAPAQPLLQLADLIPRQPEGLASMELGPGPAEGCLRVRILAPTLLADLQLADAEAVGPVAIPRPLLLELRRRHGREAERLLVEQRPDLPGLLQLRTLGAAAVVVVSAPAGEPLPPLPPPPPEPWAGPADPLRFQSAQLARLLAVLAAAGCDRVELRPVGGSGPVGLLLVVAGPLSGELQLARLAPPEPAC